MKFVVIGTSGVIMRSTSRSDLYSSRIASSENLSKSSTCAGFANVGVTRGGRTCAKSV